MRHVRDLARTEHVGGHDLAGLVEDHRAELPAQQNERFILGRVGMAVRLDIGIRAHRVEKALAGIFVRGVQVGILAPPRRGRGLGRKSVQKRGIEDADGAHGGTTPSKYIGGREAGKGRGNGSQYPMSNIQSLISK